MAKNGLTFTFENPNTPRAFEQMLKTLLIDKLSRQTQTASGKKQQAAIPTAPKS